MRRRTAITTALVAGTLAVAGLAPAGVAAGRGRPQVDLSGTGTYEMDPFGVFAIGDGGVEGPPFDGRVTFMLRTDDGSLPAPGECEGGSANLAVTGRHRELWAVATGEVCGHFVDEPTSVVTHVFVGSYSIAESSRRLRDTEGWIEIRLATADRMAVTLFDS